MIKNKKGFIAIICIGLSLSFSKAVYAESKVERLWGNDRYETAISISSSGWKNSSDYAVLSTGEDYPDALSGAPFARGLNAPIILTSKNKLNGNTKNELKRLKVKTVYIIGGTGVISKNVEDELNAINIKTIRIWGNNRYETSIKVAEKIDTTNGIFIVTGQDFADALSVSTIASKKGMPIILTSKDYLDESVQKYLSSHSIAKAYVVGDENVISDEVVSKIPNAERISGSNKYERNIAVINKFKESINLNTLYLATGRDFPDALSGSTLASITGSPIILIDDNKLQVTKEFIDNNSSTINEVNILGGEGVLPYKTINKYLDLRTETVINFQVIVDNGSKENSNKIIVKNLVQGDIVKIFKENNVQVVSDMVVENDKKELIIDDFIFEVTKNVKIQVVRGNIKSSFVTVNSGKSVASSKVFNSGVTICNDDIYKIDINKIPASLKKFSSIKAIGLDNSFNKIFEEDIKKENISKGTSLPKNNMILFVLYDNDNVLGYCILGSDEFQKYDKAQGIDIDIREFKSIISDSDFESMKENVNNILKTLKEKEEAILKEKIRIEQEQKRLAEIERVKSLVKPSIVYGTMNYEQAGFASGEVVEVINDIGNGARYKVAANGKSGIVNSDAIYIGEDLKTNYNKMSKEEIELYANVSGFLSDTSYYMWVDLDRQVVNVFQNDNGTWKLIRTMDCATGRNRTPTIRGNFVIWDRGPRFGQGEGAKNWVRFYGNYLFHSILVDDYDNIVDDTLGMRLSHGCIRISMENSEWVYNYIPKGTAVWVN